ncbi:YoaP domain-containing protein [Pelosinus sp. sgz500959]|uniref:GNAT family N-acetyltransferase n=1 Tax=Pelosinus sp. sgz500959 TaxID=3242472 RepID=UPI003671F07D
MDIIRVNNSNIDTEHICCALSDKKGEGGAAAKKNWMKDRFEDGLVFKKLNARGKAFIEYIPVEQAWCPLAAKEYMFINCFWISGKFKGQGYANLLLEECISDAKAQGKIGLVVLSSKSKMPFLSDPAYLKHKGFQVCDMVKPYYELLVLPFYEQAEKPTFKECCRQGVIEHKGIVLYYSDQCPHTEKYATITANIAHTRGVALTLIKYQTKEQAQNGPAPFTTYSLFWDGAFVTHEILSEKKFVKLLDRIQL